MLVSYSDYYNEIGHKFWPYIRLII